MFKKIISEIQMPHKSILMPYISVNYLQDLFCGDLISYKLLRTKGRAFNNFYIHPDGYIYNTDLSKADFTRLLKLRHAQEVLKETLNDQKLAKAERQKLTRQLMLAEKKYQYHFPQEQFEYYEIEYPEYYWETLAESRGQRHQYLIHMNPAREYEIYRDQERFPLQIIRERSKLSKRLFPKQDYELIQQLLNTFQEMSVELLSKKYSEMQMPELLSAIKNGQDVADADLLLKELDQVQANHSREQNAHLVSLCREARYMLLAGMRKYAEAKQALQQIDETIYRVFDTAVIDFYLGNYQEAFEHFSGLSQVLDPSVRLPAVLGGIKCLYQQGCTEEAYVLFLDNLGELQEPSPKAFPVLYSQIFESGGELQAFVEQLYAREELLDSALLEDQAQDLFLLIAKQYTPEMYYNRERAVRNHYLAMFSADLKMAGNIQRLKATYISRGLFGLHHLLTDFLRSDKYSGKILSKAL